MRICAHGVCLCGTTHEPAPPTVRRRDLMTATRGSGREILKGGGGGQAGGRQWVPSGLPAGARRHGGLAWPPEQTGQLCRSGRLIEGDE